MSYLTREHVPPEALGGKRICLTCQDCNHKSGHYLDDEMKSVQNVIDAMTGSPFDNLRATLRIGEQSIRTRISSDSSAITFTNPGRREGIFADHLSKMPGDGRAVSIALDDFRLNDFRYGLAQVGWLRVAYLAAFALFGYRYILSPPLHEVREQIRQPESKLIGPFYMFRPEDLGEAPRIGFVVQPLEWHCVVIAVGPHFIILPAPDRPDIYQRLQSHSGGPIPWEIDLLEWPKGPTHLMDKAVNELLPSGNWTPKLVSFSIS